MRFILFVILGMSIIALADNYAYARSPMKITAYAPDSGDGISGSGTMASNVLPFIGAAACPIRLPFGTKISLQGRAKLRAIALRLPHEMICMDRFANLTREGIDIAIPEGFEGLTDEQRIELARVFGVVNDYPLISAEENIITFGEPKK